MCVSQAMWLRRILDKLGNTHLSSSKILCDNSSSINLSRNLVLHGRSKHIDVQFRYHRDLVKDEIVELVYCCTENHIADIMKKPLKLGNFTQLRKWECSLLKINWNAKVLSTYNPF